MFEKLHMDRQTDRQKDIVNTKGILLQIFFLNTQKRRGEMVLEL
jgi:hypothetical protein